MKDTVLPKDFVARIRHIAVHLCGIAGAFDDAMQLKAIADEMSAEQPEGRVPAELLGPLLDLLDAESEREWEDMAITTKDVQAIRSWLNADDALQANREVSD